MEISDVEKMKANKDVKGLIKALKDKDFNVQWRAAEALGKMGEPAVELLIEALKDENIYVQNKAADALGKIGEPAVEPLVEALKDENWSVRRGAANALGEIGDGRAVEPLIEALKDENWSIRRGAADALGEIKDARAIESLSKALKDEISDVRHSAAYALAAIGTPAVIAPLLEIFRTVKPSKIREDGSVTDEDKGEDGAPASALVKVSGGIEKLRSICSPDEYERILVRAHDYGNHLNPNVNRALGDIATPKAIGRLIFVLWQGINDAKMLEPVKQALVQAGKKAHPRLLKDLEKKVPTNRSLQTSLRKDILEILKESGDEQSVPTIKSVMESDAAVAEEARATIEAISLRCKGVEIPKDVGPKPKSLKPVSRTGDAYVDACFHIEFQEFDDGRDWFEMPEAKAMTEAGNAGRVEEAIRHAEVLRDKYPDFYFSYHWFAVLYRKQGRYDDARKALGDGLRLSKSKYYLCQMYGDTEWELDNLPEAVKWWIKSIVVQVSTENLDDFVSFLHLSYVAEQLGLGSACSRLRQFVDRIRIGQIRLNGDAANKLYAATRRQGTESMKRAIDLLDREYFSNV